MSTCSRQICTPTSDCLEGFYSEGFYPLISLPTRLTDTSATLIDNIFTNNLAVDKQVGLITVRLSDHLPVFCMVSGSKHRSDYRRKEGRYRLMNTGRIQQFAAELDAWSFDEVRVLGIEENVARFRNEFRDLYDKSFPWRKNKRNKKDEEKPWLDNAEFKALIHEKRNLFFKKLKGDILDEDAERLKEVCKEVNRARQRLKRAYFKEQMDDIKGDLKATWEVLGEVLKGQKRRKDGVACRYFEKDGIGVTDGDMIAKGFCDFYCNVGPDLASKIRSNDSGDFRKYMGNKVEEGLIWRPTSPVEIEEICRGLNPNKGSGWDGVSPRVIKAVATELSGSLSRLYNCCMREGYYPESFKVARVVPVFKAEDPTQYSNYRPVSVLPILSQVFERVINTRLIKFFEDNKVIIPGQYGFRTGHSTAMAIMDMVEKIRAAWTEKKVALGVFIDLKKAFDTLDHDILLKKLEHYGIRGQTLCLLRSYLNNRTQYVCYGGYKSEKSGQ